MEEVLVAALVDQRSEPTIHLFEQLAGLVEFDLDQERRTMGDNEPKYQSVVRFGICIFLAHLRDDGCEDATYDATCVQDHLVFCVLFKVCIV